jgi:inward rectifier potassium channel
MFRLANARGNNIVEAQVHVVLARDERTREGERLRRFHDLAVLRGQNAIFALSWTVVHPIVAGSPLFGETAATLEAARAEIVVSLIGFEETFSQTVHARHAYAMDDVIWNARFVDILADFPDGRRRVDYTHFHDVAAVADGDTV